MKVVMARHSSLPAIPHVVEAATLVRAHKKKKVSHHMREDLRLCRKTWLQGADTGNSFGKCLLIIILCCVFLWSVCHTGPRVGCSGRKVAAFERVH